MSQALPGSGGSDELYWHMALIALGVLLIAVLAWLVALQRRLKDVPPRLRKIVTDLGQGDVLSALRSHVANLELIDRRMDTLEDAVRHAVTVSRHGIQKVGMVRFDALKHVGGHLSFALAMLNDHDDGLIITSIYSLEECRTYAKHIVTGRCEQALSEEEQRAVVEALADLPEPDATDAMTP